MSSNIHRIEIKFRSTNEKFIYFVFVLLITSVFLFIPLDYSNIKLFQSTLIIN